MFLKPCDSYSFVQLLKEHRILRETVYALSLIHILMHGEYGVSDVCLSTLVLVDNQGVRGKILNQLTDGEVDKLRASADKLKEVIHQVEIRCV